MGGGDMCLYSLFFFSHVWLVIRPVYFGSQTVLDRLGKPFMFNSDILVFGAFVAFNPITIGNLIYSSDLAFLFRCYVQVKPSA